MCARTCLFLWLLVTPLELLPPAGQIPLRLDGLTLAGLRKFWPASSGLRSCRTASSHGRGRAVWLDALCGRRLQHQALRCGVSTEVYAMLCYAMRRPDAAMQGAAAETVIVRRRNSCRCSACRRCVVAAAGLCVGVARGGARHSYNGGAASRLLVSWTGRTGRTARKRAARQTAGGSLDDRRPRRSRGHAVRRSRGTAEASV